MKKRVLSKLLLAMLTVSLLLSGCGAEETSGNVESSQVEAEQESAEQVEKEIEGASFTWNVSDKDLYLLMRRQLEVKPSWFLGTATYADGTTGSIEADRIDLGRDGLILLVDVYYDGGESVRYQIEVPEMWEDMNLNEESQEDVEAWYEGLGGDVSQVDESAMSGSVNEIGDTSDWAVQPDNVTNKTHLQLNSSDVGDMMNLYQIFLSSIDWDLQEVRQGVANGTIDKPNGDINYNITIKEGSEWDVAFGNSSLSEVFTSKGYPSYGTPCLCCCTDYSSYKEFLDKYNLSSADFVKTDLYKSYFMMIPLSEHTLKHLTVEELECYLLNVVRFKDGLEPNIAGGDSYKDSNEYVYTSEVLLEGLYGISVEDLEAKFSRYEVRANYDIDRIFRSYHDIKRDYGFSGSVIDWYTMSESDLDSWMLKALVDSCEEDNWQNIIPEKANLIVKLGGTLPSNITYEGETTSESTIESIN